MSTSSVEHRTVVIEMQRVRVKRLPVYARPDVIRYEAWRKLLAGDEPVVTMRDEHGWWAAVPAELAGRAVAEAYPPDPGHPREARANVVIERLTF